MNRDRNRKGKEHEYRKGKKAGIGKKEDDGTMKENKAGKGKGRNGNSNR